MQYFNHIHTPVQNHFKRVRSGIKDADIVVTTDIYGSARETETLGMTGEVLRMK